MIKFFRRIRQQLLSKKKFSNYLLYAFGEVFLVVIGILIALQLNNWNENKKEIRLEMEYYCRLHEDAIIEKDQMRNLLQLAKDRLRSSNQALRTLQENNVKKIEIGTQLNLATKAIYSDFKSNNSAYEDLKSGANLNIIRDKSVIKALNQYFNKVEELKSIIMVNGQYAVDILFAHKDNFANGKNQASLRDGRFSVGLDLDLQDIIQISDTDFLSEQMKTRLQNETLEFVSVNTRQIELYNYILVEITALEEFLKSKCQG